jgi:hypothetical protein
MTCDGRLGAVSRFSRFPAAQGRPKTRSHSDSVRAWVLENRRNRRNRARLFGDSSTSGARPRSARNLPEITSHG